jgi:hypothetical protein
MNILKEYFYTKLPSIFDGFIEYTILQESLISSYDIKTLQRKLSELFNDRMTISDNKAVLEWKAYTFIIDVVNYDESDKKKLEKILDFFGYYITRQRRFDVYTSLTIEPRHPIKITELLRQKQIRNLYHITHKSNVDKIKKIGLAPRGSETSYYHPDDRIYLLYSANTTYITKFKEILARDKRFSNEEMTVLRTPFDKTYDYFLDDLSTIPSKNIYACFVLKNIPPNKLEITNL